MSLFVRVPPNSSRAIPSSRFDNFACKGLGRTEQQYASAAKSMLSHASTCTKAAEKNTEHAREVVLVKGLPARKLP